ncbi:thiol-disulfide isomerase/thioredoxin [Chryseobacterium rhizosphaerae]|uniref:TlpA family protein disulfide reductase n=1 Tax=Chryseobacterium rhizosphaerae TaxID=395937 RepID=UPI002855F4DD|nr:redoxin domain-containing protein [Chryseobacterium rhizosphaerae]MDR6545839.1 thiol-disulfide isomerase/thioredoxin [Chryseobacterium rhizosphaerae]
MKNNKLLKISAISIPVLLIGTMVYLFLNFQKKKEKIEALKNAPAFNLTTIAGTPLSSNDLDNTGIKIFVYFSPSCHFCQAEAEELSKNYQNYQNIQWIWVASESLDEIKKFAQQYQLDKKDNIFWSHDEMAVFYQKLGMSSVPYFLVYDKNNHLIKRNLGTIKLEKLISTIDEKE